jgi:hypothetical protein
MCSDLSVLRQGLTVGVEFGFGSLEELARIGWELERGIYPIGTLESAPEGVRFRLWNPPLRIGAFSSIHARWDGAPVDPMRSWVSTDRAPTPRTLDSVTRGAPLELGVGEGSVFVLGPPAGPSPGRHRVRIEWLSSAVPPTVWIEFEDEVRPPRDR